MNGGEWFVTQGSVKVTLLAATDLLVDSLVYSNGKTEDINGTALCRILTRGEKPYNKPIKIYASVSMASGEEEEDGNRNGDEDEKEADQNSHRIEEGENVAPRNANVNMSQKFNTAVYSLSVKKGKYYISKSCSDGILRIAEEFIFDNVASSQSINISLYLIVSDAPATDKTSTTCIGVTKIPISRLKANSKARKRALLHSNILRHHPF